MFISSFGAFVSSPPFRLQVFSVAVPAENGHTLRTGRRSASVFEDPVRAKKLLWSFSLFLLFTTSSYAQTRPGPPTRIDGGIPPPEDENRERIERDMAKKANLERQAALKADTDKLVKLAGELKEYVDKSNENMLSVTVLKKAEEIEKLAHSVKDKMKGPN
jgi:hypothetical protein